MKPRLSEAPLLIKAREIEQRLNNLQIFKEEENDDNKRKIVSCLKKKAVRPVLKSAPMLAVFLLINVKDY